MASVTNRDQVAAHYGAGDGTVTVVGENGSAAGVTVPTVSGWTVRYPGFRYAGWLTAISRVSGPRPASGT